MPTDPPDDLDRYLALPDALRREARPHGVVVWLGVTALAAGALVLGYLTGQTIPAVSGVAVSLGLLVAAKPVVEALGQHTYGPRGVVVAWLALLGFAPVFAILAQATLEADVVSRPFQDASRPWTNDPTLWLFCVVPMLAMLGALAVASATLLGRRERRTVSWSLRGGVWLAVAGAGALCVVGTVRALTRPTPWGYLDALPVVARLAPPAAGAGAPSPAVDDDVPLLGAAWLHRHCAAGLCVVQVTVPPREPSRWPVAPVDLPTTSTDPLVVRRDAASRIAVIEWPGHRVAFRAPLGYPREPPQVTNVLVRDLARVSRPHLGWVALAWLGVAIGVWSWVRRNHAARSAGAWRAARVGVDGRVVLADQTPVELPPGSLGATVGDVVVRPAAGLVPATYRQVEAFRAERAVAGKLDALQRAARAMVEGRLAFGLAAAVLCNLPLACSVYEACWPVAAAL